MLQGRNALPRKILELITCCAILASPLPALAQATILSENFDGAWTTPTTLQSSTCGYPPCYWYGSGDIVWQRGVGGAESTPYSATFDSQNAPAGSRGAILTPWMNVLGLRGPLALFFWYLNVSGTDSLFVSITNDGVNYTRVLSLGIASTWTRHVVNIGLTGGHSSCQVKFEAQSDHGNSVIKLDNMAVMQGLGGTAYIGYGERLANWTQAVAEYESTAATGQIENAKFLEKGPVIETELLPLNLVSVPSIGGTFTTTFGPDSGVVATTSGSSATAVWVFNGANHVVLDGGSGWNVFNTNNAGGTACVWLTQGASNDTVRGLTLSCGVDPRQSSLETFGVISSGASISNSSDGINNDGNVIEYNNIFGVQTGIHYRGSLANPNDNVVIRHNIVGPATLGPGQIRRGGIIAQHQNAITITDNVVRGVGLQASDGAPATDAIGIGVGSNVWPPAASAMTGAYVARNDVHTIRNGKGQSAVALAVASSVTPSSNTVANNMVRDVLADGTNLDQAVGIGVGAGSGDRIVDNSLSLYGDIDPAGSATATQSAVGIRVASTLATNLTVKDNVVAVGWTSNTGTLRHYCEVVPSTSFSWGTGGNDHNDYWPDPVSSQATLGGIGTTVPYSAVTTLATWRTQFTPNQDGASISEAPPFVSSSDLHLQTGIPTGLESVGIPIAGVVDDFDGEIRSVSTPDIGCDEGSFTPLTINHPPVLREIADIIPRWGRTAIISPIASDRDCLPLHFSALNLPPGASINATNGRITWPVPSCPNSTYPNVTLIATDDCGAADTVTFGIHPLPQLLSSCFVREAYVPKLTAYPADANHDFVEDQLMLPTGPAGVTSTRSGSGPPNVEAATDTIPGDVFLIFNQCDALAGANRDAVSKEARILWEPDIVAAALVRTVRANLLHLAGMSFVSMVAANHRFGAALDTSARVLGVRPSSTYSPATVEDSLLNVDGAGVTVVILDSGVDGDHESLQGKCRSGVSFVSGTGDSISGDPPDLDGHGTASAGAAVGKGNGLFQHIGIAKAAAYSDVCVLAPNGTGGLVGTEADVIAGLQYALANYGSGAITYIGIEGDNLSYGADPSVLWNGTDLLSTTINAVTQLGLVVVVPVGNVDPANTPLLPPAVAEDAIVVAASAHMGTVPIDDDQIAPFSKIGPREPDGDGDTVDEEIPHIAVPGTDLPTGGTGIIVPQANTVNQYVGVQGTSVAAAQLAGVFALMQQVTSGSLSSVGGRQLLEETADTIAVQMTRARPPGVEAQGWNAAWGHGLVNAFRLLDQLIPQANLGFDVYCNGPGEWYYSTDIQVLDPILLGDSVRVTVRVHNKSTARRVVGFTLEVGAYSFGNSPFQGVFHIFTDNDPLLPGEYRTFECKWYVNPGLSKPHGCIKAFLHYARDGGAFDNCAQRNIDIIGYGSTNVVAEQVPGRLQLPSRAQSAPPVSEMFVANVLPENVQVTLHPSLIEGSGWTLVCSETTLTFPMVKNEPPRKVIFRGIRGGVATDSSVWTVSAEEKGACNGWNSGGGRIVARTSELTGTGGAIVQLPTLILAPRPFRQSLDITFALPTAGPIGIRFFDVMGREVWRLDLGQHPAGVAHARWDGRTNGGGDAAPGIYFARARLGGVELGQRVIRLK